MNSRELSALLEEHRPQLERFVERHAGTSLKHEAVEDLVQGIHLKAISRAGNFEYRSRPEFEAWVFRVGRAHLADRREHWNAAKRRPERLLRLTRADSDSTDPSSAREPAGEERGPATRADHAEQLALAQEALTLLLPRDADLIRGEADGLSIQEQADQQGMSYAAMQRARLRALERYRKAFLLLARGK